MWHMPVCMLVCAYICVWVCVHLHTCMHAHTYRSQNMPMFVCTDVRSQDWMSFSLTLHLVFLEMFCLWAQSPWTDSEKEPVSAAGVCLCLPTLCKGHTCIAALIAALGALQCLLGSWTRVRVLMQQVLHQLSHLPSPSFILNVQFTDVKYSLPQFLELSSFVLYNLNSVSLKY